jgi:hypothetical protein
MTMPKPLEPTLDALHNPFLRYFAATRPAFLSVTFVGCLLGLATAAHSGIRWARRWPPRRCSSPWWRTPAPT